MLLPQGHDYTKNTPGQIGLRESYETYFIKKIKPAVNKGHK